MKFNNINKIFNSFDRLRVLVIGDIMIDSYIWGDVERISPEAPVPIVASKNKENRLGGAANVAINIQSLGAEPVICSVVGDSNYSILFNDLLKRQRITSEGIINDHGRSTTVKTRILSNNQQLLRIDEEKIDPIPPAIENKFVERIKQIIKKRSIHAIIFEDYDKGALTPYVIRTTIEEANKAYIPILADPKERNFFEYKNITLLKPNYREFIKGVNRDIEKDDFENIYLAAKDFKEKMNIEYLLITLAEHGLICVRKKGYKNVPAIEKLDIADVSGAGDTVISTLSVCMAAGMDIDDASIIANLAGGLVCEKAGVVPVDKKQLLKEIKSGLYF